VLALFLICHHVISFQEIIKFGAVPNEDTLIAQQKNQAAINQAIAKANSPESFGDNRTVLIEKKFYTLPITIANAHDLVI